MTGNRKQLSSDELKMGWTGHVARMGEKRDAYWISFGKLEVKKNLGDMRVDEMIILKWIFKFLRWEGLCLAIWLRMRTGGRHL